MSTVVEKSIASPHSPVSAHEYTATLNFWLGSFSNIICLWWQPEARRVAQLFITCVVALSRTGQSLNYSFHQQSCRIINTLRVVTTVYGSCLTDTPLNVWPPCAGGPGKGSWEDRLMSAFVNAASHTKQSLSGFHSRARPWHIMLKNWAIMLCSYAQKSHHYAPYSWSLCSHYAPCHVINHLANFWVNKH